MPGTPTLEISTENAIIYQFPPGKPDRHNPHQRIKQKAQKGATCAYYANRRISSYQAENRANEQLISLNRKKLTQQTEKHDLEKYIVAAVEETKQQYPNELLLNLSNDELQLIDVADDKVLDAFISEYVQWEKQRSGKHIDNNKYRNKFGVLFASHHLPRFLEKKQRHERIALMDEALLSYGVDVRKLKCGFEPHPEQLNKQLRQELSKNPDQDSLAVPPGGNFFDCLSKQHQDYVLHQCMLFVEAQLIGLTMESFSDDITKDELMEVLRTKGPIVVNGKIGQGFYEPGSEIVKAVANREVYAFPPGAYREKSPSESHVIVVAGVVCKGYQGATQDMVFYHDPLDESEIDKPVKTRIISWEKFKERTLQRRQYYIEAGYLKTMSLPYLYNPRLASQPELQAYADKKPSLATSRNTWFNDNKDTIAADDDEVADVTAEAGKGICNIL